jgi:hypothetical protein
METVVIERWFEEPVAFQEIQDLEDAGSWCLDLYSVTFLKTFFSRDRKRMICLYEAPDAEAVRRAERQAKVPFDLAWTGEPLDIRGGRPPLPANAPEGEFVVVERMFEDPVVLPELLDRIRERGGCLETYGADYLEAYLSPDRRRMLCLFRAPDTEAVRNVNRTMEVPAVRVYPVTLHIP